MATCIGTVDGKAAGCRRDIKPVDINKAHVLKDDDGKVIGMLHNKCWYVVMKHKRMGANGRHGEPPTAYEVSAQRRTASDLTDEAIATRERAEAVYAAAVAKREDLLVRAAQGSSQGGSSEDVGLTLAELLDRSAAEVQAAAEAKSLAEHQAELAAERAKEDDRTTFTDWRDPAEVEI